jgi:putative hydrolase of the HAD superfamily
VFCPSEIEWELERAPAPDAVRFRAIPHLGELPDLVAGLL